MSTDIYPVPPAYADKISQPFGNDPTGALYPWNASTGGHLGMDYDIPMNTPVIAIADGVVLHADWGYKLTDDGIERAATLPDNSSEEGGICIYIDHGGSPAWISCYAHLNRTDLNAGDQIKRGQILGYSGTTGQSTGPHLHFECILKDRGGLRPGVEAGILWARYNPALQIDAENARARVTAAAQTAKPVQNARPVAQRTFITGAVVSNVRDGSIASARVTRTIPPGSNVTVKGYKRGRKLGAAADASIWYVLHQSKRKDGGLEFMHSSTFRTRTIDGLKEYK